ncbi:hypothetical protein [Microcoleus sp. D2_18a_D3]|uniref:hypothetical protein n=2 Tax=unclassified Microcoleus TaxID=2642155 RepID=UPI002FD0DE4D
MARHIDVPPKTSLSSQVRFDAVIAALQQNDFPNVVNSTLGVITIMPKNPAWLRYDPDENISRHAATDDEYCYEMETKYGWTLKRIEKLKGDTLKADCVFDGKTEFPKPFHEQDDDDA